MSVDSISVCRELRLRLIIDPPFRVSIYGHKWKAGGYIGIHQSIYYTQCECGKCEEDRMLICISYTGCAEEEFYYSIGKKLAKEIYDNKYKCM